MGVDDGAPREADAPGPGEGAASEAAEDAEEDVAGEAQAVGDARVHRSGTVVCVDRLARGCRVGGDAIEPVWEDKRVWWLLRRGYVFSF